MEKIKKTISIKPFHEDEYGLIYNADCLEVMREMPNECVDLVVTSPPYDELRDYQGYSFNFEEIAKELYRVIKQGGVVVWVVGDMTIDGSESGSSFRQALFFKGLGFNLHDTMIYAKENYLPQLKINKRYASAFEFMFILSKGKSMSFNPIMKPSIYCGLTKSGTFRRKDGRMRNKIKCTNVNDEHISPNIWSYLTGQHKSTKDLVAFEHPAIFPDKLAEDHIISWSNEGDIVLDPMCGSGTTCKMAKYTNRKYIGIDTSEDYCKIAEERLAQKVLTFPSKP